MEILLKKNGIDFTRKCLQRIVPEQSDLMVPWNKKATIPIQNYSILAALFAPRAKNSVMTSRGMPLVSGTLR